MKSNTATIYYQTIEKAIAFLRKNFQNQPSLGEIAAEVGLSEFHFQKIFSDWAGISPKQFLKYTTLEFAKQKLLEEKISDQVAQESGLSGSSRLHDLFVSIESMSPGEFKSGAMGLQIQYSFNDTIFGKVLVASTQRGICYVQFFDDTQKALQALFESFPNAQLLEFKIKLHELVTQHIDGKLQSGLKLHLNGTGFQIKVWKALLSIEQAEISTYKNIAIKLGQKTASRAVGTAIGKNPVAVIIPCHRVLRMDGEMGGYRWGVDRKAALLAFEQCKKQTTTLENKN